MSWIDIASEYICTDLILLFEATRYQHKFNFIILSVSCKILWSIFKYIFGENGISETYFQIRIYFYGSVPLHYSLHRLIFTLLALHSVLSLSIFISFFFLNFAVIYDSLKLCDYLLMHKCKLCILLGKSFIIIRIFLYWIGMKDCHMFRTFLLSNCSEFSVLEAYVTGIVKTDLSGLQNFFMGLFR